MEVKDIDKYGISASVEMMQPMLSFFLSFKTMIFLPHSLFEHQIKTCPLTDRPVNKPNRADHMTLHICLK